MNNIIENFVFKKPPVDTAEYRKKAIALSGIVDEAIKRGVTVTRIVYDPQKKPLDGWLGAPGGKVLIGAQRRASKNGAAKSASEGRIRRASKGGRRQKVQPD